MCYVHLREFVNERYRLQSLKSNSKINILNSSIWKIKKFKMAAPPKFFGQMGIVDELDTLWVENLDEIALSRSVKEIAKFLCFGFFAKNSKIQNGSPKKFSGKWA